MTKMEQVREIAWLELGYSVHDDIILNALSSYAGATDASVKTQLDALEAIFAGQGGRGVDLADRIDALKIVKAVRDQLGIINMETVNG